MANLQTLEKEQAINRRSGWRWWGAGGGGESSGVFLKDEGCFTSLYLLQNDEDTTYLIQI